MADKIFIENAKVTKKGVELKTSQAGKPYAQFQVMWSSSKKDQSGQRVYGPTKWVTVRVSGFQANDVAANVHADDRVNLIGSIEHHVWESNNGPKDDWSMFAESVLLSVPRAQQQGGLQAQPQQQRQGGFSQPQGDPWNSAPPAGGFGGSQDDQPPF